jgi:hypothetical protein
MRIRTTLLAAILAATPLIAVAQTTTAPPATPPAADSTTAAPAKPHHHMSRADWQKFRAERHAKYAALSAEDKAKFDGLTKQIRDLHHQQMQMLGLSKS